MRIASNLYFLSTLSLRRATICTGMRIASNLFFYPRSPCGERLSAELRVFRVDFFYPRSPCGERHVIVHSAHPHKSFLSTLSLRRATTQFWRLHPKYLFSIHALLAESDGIHLALAYDAILVFYPRSPCGERLRGWTLNINGPIFLSTLSLRRATGFSGALRTTENHFLSTLSLRRATHAPSHSLYLRNIFYPRSPCGERRLRFSGIAPHIFFYPRSPCGERRGR